MNHNVKVATYPASVANNAGQTRCVEGSTVEFVCLGQPCHISKQKYTKDYSKISERPYVVEATGRGYKTLGNAVRALFKNGFEPIQDKHAERATKKEV